MRVVTLRFQDKSRGYRLFLGAPQKTENKAR